MYIYIYIMYAYNTHVVLEHVAVQVQCPQRRVLRQGAGHVRGALLADAVGRHVQRRQRRVDAQRVRQRLPAPATASAPAGTGGGEGGKGGGGAMPGGWQSRCGGGGWGGAVSGPAGCALRTARVPGGFGRGSRPPAWLRARVLLPGRAPVTERCPPRDERYGTREAPYLSVQLGCD